MFEIVKFVSLAPYYFDGSGHNIEYQACLKDAALSLGLEFELLLPKKHSVGLLPFQSLDFFPKRGKFFAWFGLFRKPQVLFLESFGIKDLPGLYVASFFLHKNAKLALLFRRGFCESFSKRLALKLFSGCLSRRRGVSLFTDSEMISQELGNLTVLPIPHAPAASNMSSSSKIVCYWPGVPRETKGLLALKQLAASIDKERFELVAARASALQNATLVENHLSRTLYEAELCRADVVLLPYDPVQYRSGTSGVLVEAVSLGKLPLVRDGSWLAFELKKHGLEECIIDWTPSHVWSIIPKLLKDEAVKEKLQAMQTHYRRFHNQISFNEMLADRLQ